MGMTDRQFDLYQALLLSVLQEALEETPENKRLQKLIAMIEAGLKRP